MADDLVPLGALPDAWRKTVHGVTMSKVEYDLSCEIETDIQMGETSAILQAIAIGLKLITFKEILGHKRFGAWRRGRFGEVDRTCQRNMLIAKHFGSCSETVQCLSLTLVREFLERKHKRIYETQIRPDIDNGKVLDASAVRAILPAKSSLQKRIKTVRQILKTEDEIVEKIVTTMREYDDSTVSIITHMDQFRLGEMIISRMLTST